MLGLKDEFASLMDWTHQTAPGQCFCSALVDVSIVRGVFVLFPPQEQSGLPDGVIGPLVGMFEVINRTALLAAVATATDTGTPTTLGCAPLVVAPSHQQTLAHRQRRGVRY
jgi:hypothetical protein